MLIGLYYTRKALKFAQGQKLKAIEEATGKAAEVTDGVFTVRGDPERLTGGQSFSASVTLRDGKIAAVN